jgi:carboxylesterase type B
MLRESRFRRVAGLLCLTVAVFGVLPTGSAAARAASTSPVVPTDSGAVRGTGSGGIESWLGIPYAAAPVGELRWASPHPSTRWTGVRAATRYGNACPAQKSTNGPRSENEDCLFVNVQRPAGTRSAARLPVYVFIHGGGLTNGSSTQMNMDKIVRETGVIGVTMNYRLGVFGFLGLPALTATDGESGNYGFQDQQAALRWVRRNIARFGGDPSRVTIGGESAGGWSVCAHLAAPGSRGLFAGAMMQSGSCVSRTQAVVEAVGTAFARSAGCPEAATALACLRAAPAGTLLDAGATFSASLVHGTATLPIAPDDAVRTGRFSRVPVVVGANHDEGRTFSAGMIGWTKDQYLAWVRSSYPSRADSVLAAYPWPAGATRFTAAYLIGAIETDSGLLAGIGGCTNRTLTREFARYTRTYAYEFDHPSGPGVAPIPGYHWGAGHAAELAYLWPSFNNGTPIAPTFNAGERRLAREMVQYWGSFVKQARPGAKGQPIWPAYNRRAMTLSLRAGGRSTVITDATYRAGHHCDLWDA